MRLAKYPEKQIPIYVPTTCGCIDWTMYLFSPRFGLCNHGKASIRKIVLYESGHPSLRELRHGCCTLFRLTLFTRFENVLTYGEFLYWKREYLSSRAVYHDIVERVLILIVTDN